MEDSKKIIKLVLIVLAILVLYLSGCFIYKQKKIAPYEKAAEEFQERLANDEAFRNAHQNEYVDAKRSDEIFSPRGLITVFKDRITLNIHPTISGGFDTTVTIQEKRGGTVVAQFDIDEHGTLLDTEKQVEYLEYHSEIVDTMEFANEVFGDIFDINR